MEILLGIDWGEVKVGLAMADTETKVAVPLGTVNSASAVIEVIKKEKIDRIIIGFPKTKMGDLANMQKIHDFLHDIKAEVTLPIDYADEQFTSRLADKLRNQAGDRQAKKAMADQDAIAAMIILETYLTREINKI